MFAPPHAVFRVCIAMIIAWRGDVWGGQKWDPEDDLFQNGINKTEQIFSASGTACILYILLLFEVKMLPDGGGEGTLSMPFP
jgi:hypothetical protein